MKPNFFYFFTAALCICTVSHAAYKDKQFVQEIRDGLVVTNITYGAKEFKGGELAGDVYSMDTNLTQAQCCANSSLYCCEKKVAAAITKEPEYDLFIPTDMYIRMGASLTLPFLTSDATYASNDNFTASSAGTWGVQIGLGWNLNPQFRAELDAKVRNFRFSDAPWSAYELKAKTQGVGGTLYFDFIPRYERHGDVTERRRFVPYAGIGLSFGGVDFSDAGVQPIGFGHGDRSAYIAPRGVLGLSIGLSDFTSLDLEYQFEAMASSGFGWETPGGISGISDITASLRFNF